jgi:hypothetical protein
MTVWCRSFEPHESHQWGDGWGDYECPGYPVPCDGSRSCEAKTHLHGCFADDVNADCNDRDQHAEERFGDEGGN